MTHEREFDLIIYGASGFTGRQAVAYLARRTTTATLRWAMAGRDLDKLQRVRAALGSDLEDIPILVAESADQAAVDGLVARTRVLASTAGPYALYGNALVDACVRYHTHYVDITGETLWVRKLIDAYHHQAASTGTRIVPFCGFDSVPSDLGTYLIARHIQIRLGKDCKSVCAYFQMQGGFNGGTVMTLLHTLESKEARRTRDPYLLNAGNGQTPSRAAKSTDPLLPFYDSELAAWVGPYFMAPINTRVVRRSASLYRQWQQAYGVAFHYQEYLKFGGKFGALFPYATTLASVLFMLALKSPLKPWLKAHLPRAGEGPSESAMNNGWYRCELLGTASDGQKVRGVIADQGDPGNRATVRYLCESALCLAVNADELPGGPQRGGVLTPATAFGDVLAKRLGDAGVTIDIGDRC
jgi:short subunit dehydrogenase-like uncharacterized protein